LGFVNFTIIDPAEVCWGFYTKPSAPPGTGTAMGRVALAYAFKEQGFEKVIGEALSFNESSISFHRKLGFKQVGTRTDESGMTSVPADVYVFGLTRSEWCDYMECQA
jgi:RimJ/RimL family protein N-acetyltransferase